MLCLYIRSTSKRIKKHHSCIAGEETSMPGINSQELVPGVTNPNNADYEANNSPNEEMESEQDAIRYTNNPTYETLAGSHTYKESDFATTCSGPVEAKRNEGYPRGSVIRNADTLHGLVQNKFVPVQYSSMSIDQDVGKHTNVPDYRKSGNTYDDTLSPSIECSTIGHQSVQNANTRIVQGNIHVATENLPATTKSAPICMTKPSLQNHKMCGKVLNTKPSETDV